MMVWAPLSLQVVATVVATVVRLTPSCTPHRRLIAVACSMGQTRGTEEA